MSALTAPVRAPAPTSNNPWRWLVGGVAVVFGLATLAEGGGVLFGGPEARAAAGQVVPFVLAFNFGAGFFYIAAGMAALAGQRWALTLARALALGSAAVWLALGFHVVMGGAFEMRTAVAMTLRTTFWVAQALILPGVLGARRMP